MAIWLSVSTNCEDTQQRTLKPAEKVKLANTIWKKGPDANLRSYGNLQNLTCTCAWTAERGLEKNPGRLHIPSRTCHPQLSSDEGRLRKNSLKSFLPFFLGVSKLHAPRELLSQGDGLPDDRGAWLVWKNAFHD